MGRLDPSAPNTRRDTAPGARARERAPNPKLNRVAAQPRWARETTWAGNRLLAERVWRIATVRVVAALWRFATSNSVRLTPRSTDPAVKAILDPRRLLRWVLIGRLCLAS